MRKTSKSKNIEVTNVEASEKSGVEKKKQNTKGSKGDVSLPSGQYKVSRKYGVSTLNDDGKKTKVSSFITFKANLENDKTGKVSVLAVFIDHQGKTKETSIPREDFNKIERVIEKLTSQGFCIHDQKLTKLYLSECYQLKPPMLNIRVVNEPGWHQSGLGEKKVYVVNGNTFSSEGDRCNIVLDESVNAGFSSKGSNEEWQKHVGNFCKGNSRLTLLVCASLLGPLLEFLGLQNVGLHVFGSSKSAKTTCLIIARSIYGDQYFSFSWNATTGALQETANSRNHSVLMLDEISQCDGKHLSASVYSLMNGLNKNRLTPDCKLSSVRYTELVVISTGEFSLQEHLAQDGIKVKPGQLVRLPSVPVHLPKGMFPNLHGEPSIGAISLKLRASVEEHYGTIGASWIQHLVDNQLELKASLQDKMKEIQVTLLASIDVDEPSEAQREVAKSFAAIACAGEEAISCGLMPWSNGSAIKAATTCYRAWHKHETGASTKREPFPSIKKYFKTKKAEFQPLEKYAKGSEASVYTHQSDGIDVLLVPLSKSKDTLFKVFGEKDVLGELDKRGLLVRGCDSRPTKQLKIPKSTLPRQSFYVIRRSILATK